MPETRLRIYTDPARKPEIVTWNLDRAAFPKRRREIDGLTYSLKETTGTNSKKVVAYIIKRLRSQGYKHIRVLRGTPKEVRMNHDFKYLIYVRRTH